MSGSEEVSRGTFPQTSSQSLKDTCSVSDDSLSGSEPIVESSPQSFAALKQAYNYMLPHFKSLQTDKRSLQKENEELKKLLSDREEEVVEMSDNFEQGYPDDLQSRGQPHKRQSATLTPEEQNEDGSREEQFRVSPSAMDSAINLNDGNSLIVEKSVREERSKWLIFCWQLLLQFPVENMCNLKQVPEHCLNCLEEYVTDENLQDRGLLNSKLEELRLIRGTSEAGSDLRTSQIVNPVTQSYHSSPTRSINHRRLSKGSPTGKYNLIISDDDPSDEDIYTSGLPTRARIRKSVDDEEEGEFVRVENAMDVFERCALFIRQSLEVNSELVRKLEEKKQQKDVTTSSLKIVHEAGGLPSSISHQLPAVKPTRSRPVFPDLSSQNGGLLYNRQFDHLRNQPSTASDPGRMSTNMSHLNLGTGFISDPSASRRWSNGPKHRGRPLSEADIQAPLHELPVKYPPLPYGVESSYKAVEYSNEEARSSPSYAHMTIDHNFQFDDGSTYQPCGPPETDFSKFQEDEDEEVISWNAARNPDFFDEIPLPDRRVVARSDPVKDFPRKFSGSANSESYPRGLPRSSDRIYDMKRFGDPGGTEGIYFQSGSNQSKGIFGQTKKIVNCPVCSKAFDADTPEVAINSHVNLHFEDDRKNFEVIE